MVEIATQEIGTLITAIQQELGTSVQAISSSTQQVQRCLKSTEEAGERLQRIIEGAEGSADMVRQIATAATQQCAATDEINSHMVEIGAISQTSAAQAQESARDC